MHPAWGVWMFGCSQPPRVAVAFAIHGMGFFTQSHKPEAIHMGLTFVEHLLSAMHRINSSVLSILQTWCC